MRQQQIGQAFFGGRFWDQLRHLVSKEASWNSVFAHQVTHDFKVIYVTLRWQEKSDLSFYFLTLLDDKRNLFFLFYFGHSFARNVIFFFWGHSFASPFCCHFCQQPITWYNTWSVTFQPTCEELLRLLLCVFILQNFPVLMFFHCLHREAFKVLVNFTSNAFLLCSQKLQDSPTLDAFAVCIQNLQIFQSTHESLLMLLLCVWRNCKLSHFWCFCCSTFCYFAVGFVKLENFPVLMSFLFWLFAWWNCRFLTFDALLLALWNC